MKQNILVSACLLGINCKYNGGANTSEALIKLKDSYNLIPFCPEVYGGLPTPREPSEIVGDRVISCDGTDVTECFERGAKEALKTAQLYGCKLAVLKQRSPSCGFGEVYDGSFSGKTIKGDGITARLLKQNGIEIIGEDKIQDFFEINC
ncbi:MAG: DUF523 domain-containing protein [Clostridia bacterium]|nr:DUF523 domain-containing protein [Clostridia bacterium]